MTERKRTLEDVIFRWSADYTNGISDSQGELLVLLIRKHILDRFHKEAERIISDDSITEVGQVLVEIRKLVEGL